MLRHLALVIVLIGGAFCAKGGITTETEPNDTFATGNPLGSVSYGDGVVASIMPTGDLDFFQFQPTFTTGYADLTTPLTISLYESDHTLIASDTGISLALTSLTLGDTYYLRINAPGNNSEVPSYTATFEATAVPEPELAGPVAFVLGRRRLAKVSARLLAMGG